MEDWKKPEYTHRLQENVLFVRRGDWCYQITSNGNRKVVALKTTHEEVGGHMFLHAADAATHGYNSVLISSDDTDVFVICLAFSCRYTVEIVLEMWYQSTYKSPGRREISKITMPVGH